MADKVCCPGPICGSNNNNAAAGGFREAVCVHTKKVYDSCRSKECLRDIRVYLCRDAQELINAGGIASVKPRAAELLCVKIDVERVQFNSGIRCFNVGTDQCGSKGNTCNLRLPGLLGVTRTVLV